MTNVDWTVSAEEAKHLGLIDHVSIPRLANHQPMAQLTETTPYDEQVKRQLSNPMKSQRKTKKTHKR